MTDQATQDQETAGRLRDARQQVRRETAGAFAEAVRQQNDAVPGGDRELQLFPQLQQHLAEAVALQQVQEQPFRSRVPLIGPLIAWFRGLWNRVSTTWYVRPLLQQQVAFNAAVVRVLQDLYRYNQVSSNDLLRRSDALFDLTRQELAVLSARCDDLQGALGAMEASLERLRAALQATPGG